MPVITHNLMSQFANRQLNITSNNKLKSLEKLSSGYRINRAGDDAAGLAISEKMRWQIRGLDRASRNIEDGKSLLNVADGALTEVHRMLQRMNELTIQAANDTNTYADRSAIQQEINQLLQAIEKVNTDTRFNTQPVFGGGLISGGGSVAPPTGPIDPINDVTLSLPQGIDVAINASNINRLLHKNADGSYELEDGHTYTFANIPPTATFHISSGATVTIKDSSLEDCGIVCDNATLYISNVSVTNRLSDFRPGYGYGYNGAPVTCYGNTTINFLGKNYLQGGEYFPLNYSDNDWNCYAGIQVERGNNLTLNGNGTLTAVGGMGWNAPSGSTGSGRIGTTGSAGIGSSASGTQAPEPSGNITIHSGYIHAAGENRAAGIGGACGGDMNDPKGSVNGNIYIDGGSVYAWADQGTGIGAGSYCPGETPGTISISGGTVEAVGGVHCAAIGGGLDGNGADVTISGGTVLAKGGKFGAGIGSGCCYHAKAVQTTSGNITISGGNVTAIAGIGDTYNHVPSAIGQGGYFSLPDATVEENWFRGFGKLTVDGVTEDMYIEGRSQIDHQADGDHYIYTYQGKQVPPVDTQSNKGLWWIQMGATEGNGIFISTGSISRQDLGLDDLEVYSHQKAGFAVTKVQNAIDKVSDIRSHIGAQFNRLEHGVLIDDDTAENTQAAESRIRDTDMASELVDQSIHSILQQAGESMLAQANQISNEVLKLLQ